LAAGKTGAQDRRTSLADKTGTQDRRARPARTTGAHDRRKSPAHQVGTLVGTARQARRRMGRLAPIREISS
jgi:hypothetical protein